MHKKPPSRVLRGKKASVINKRKAKVRYKTKEIERDLVQINKNVGKHERRVKKLFRYLLRELPSAQERNCLRAAEEIYCSERKYNNDLLKLIETKKFMASLQHTLKCNEVKDGTKKCRHGRRRHKCDQISGIHIPTFNESDLDSIFMNIITLQPLHQKTVEAITNRFSRFYKKLCKGESLSVVVLFETICEVFSDMAPYWKMYTLFVQRFENSMKTLARLRTQDELYKQYESEINEICGMSLMYLLNIPMQRITKYPLLFKALSKHIQGLAEALTNETQKEELVRLIQRIEEVEKRITDIVNSVNTKMGIAAELDKMCKVVARFGGNLKTKNLLQPWRRLKFEAELVRFEHGLDVVQTQCKLYVFTDMFIVTSTVRDELAHFSSQISPKRRMSKVTHQSSFSLKKVQREGSFGASSDTTMNSVASRASRISSFTSFLSTRRSVKAKLESRHDVPFAEMTFKSLKHPKIALDRSAGYPTYLLSYEDRETNEEIIFYFLKSITRTKVFDLFDELQRESPGPHPFN